MSSVSNRAISERLYEYSTVLEQQKANQFRIRAYRRAAATVEGLEEDVGLVYRRGGIESLVALPNIGKGIASAIAELLQTGRLARLERLRGALEPARLFQIVPGIGPKLAARIHDELGIDTLEALELAAHDGRLETIPGISHRRAQIIRASLQTLLTTPRPAFHRDSANGPDVGSLLEVDKSYREKAGRGELPTIAPKDGNTGVEMGGIQLGKIHDWVVIYFYNDHHEEGQHTVVTETSGPLIGKRVVRGRETECRAYYQ